MALVSIVVSVSTERRPHATDTIYSVSFVCSIVGDITIIHGTCREQDVSTRWLTTYEAIVRSSVAEAWSTASTTIVTETAGTTIVPHTHPLVHQTTATIGTEVF
tara:strand:+ start:128 stop:439 length:312 start_codon:yes stop_codon:yes gene_type:complete